MIYCPSDKRKSFSGRLHLKLSPAVTNLGNETDEPVSSPESCSTSMNGRDVANILWGPNCPYECLSKLVHIIFGVKPWEGKREAVFHIILERSFSSSRWLNQMINLTTKRDSRREWAVHQHFSIIYSSRCVSDGSNAHMSVFSGHACHAAFPFTHCLHAKLCSWICHSIFIQFVYEMQQWKSRRGSKIIQWVKIKRMNTNVTSL